jgi:flagellar biosynthesis anti-sigma factor FlgM
MRIENPILREVVVSQPREVQQVDQRIAEKIGTKTTVQRDETILSEEAQLLLRVREAITNAPEVREDLIVALRQQIQAGAYQIDEEALVDALLGSALTSSEG